MNDMFDQGLRILDINLSDQQRNQFFRYYELLVEWNKVMNLTSITDYEEVCLKHYIDSLSIVSTKVIENGMSVIDIGTGAGFPGLPLKIIYPDIEIVLLDSLKKRINFLDCVINELKLEKIKTLHGRAEDYARQNQYRESFDLSVSRAVSNLAILSEYCIPYVRNGGCFISYKSGNIDEEIEQSKKAAETLGGRIIKVDKFILPGSDIKRSFVNIEKISPTPEKYPRKSGIPEKKPLK